MTTAAELMTRRPVVIDPATKVGWAVQLLQSLDVRHLPVVDHRGALVGMVSDRDLRSLSVPVFVGAEYVGDLRTPAESPVAEIMTTEVRSVRGDAHVSEVVDLMLEHKIGAVPVVEDGGVLVGIISYVDVLRAMRSSAGR